MKTVYSLLEDKKEIKVVQEKIKKGLSGYRTKWGLFGSSEWFENIRNNNLIEIIDGEICDIYMAGHNDFPMFCVTDGKSTYQFEQKGNEQDYQKGGKVHIEAIRNENIYPSSGLEKLLIPLKIKIELYKATLKILTS